VSTLKSFYIQDSVVFDGEVDDNEWFGVHSNSNIVLRIDGTTLAKTAKVFGRNEDFGSASREKTLMTVYIYGHTPFKNMCLTIIGEYNGKRTEYGPFCLDDLGDTWDNDNWDEAFWVGEFIFKRRVDLPAGVLVNRAQLKFETKSLAGDNLSLDGYEVHYVLLPEV